MVFLILARLLSPQAFGLVAMASVVTALLRSFVEQGLGEAVVQRKEIEPHHLDAAFWLQSFGALASSALLVGAAPAVAKFFEQPELTPIVRWLAVSPVVHSLTVTQVAILKRELRFKVLAARRIISVVAGGAVGVVMALDGYGAWSLVGQRLGNGVAGVIALWAVTDWRPRLRFSPRHARDLFSYSIHVVGTHLLGFINRRSDNLLIGFFLGATALGYYTVAYRVLLIMTQLLISVISQVALPTFARLQYNPARIRNAFLYVTRLVGAYAIPAFLGVAVMAPDLLLIIDEKWLPASPVMRVLSFIGVVHSLGHFNGTVLRAMGRPGIVLGLSCITAALNLTVFFVFVHWGILAVALAYTIRGYLVFPLALILLRRMIKLPLGEYGRNLIPTAVSALVMLAVMWISHAWWMASWPVYGRILASASLGFVIYLAMLYATGPKTLFDIYGTIMVPFHGRRATAQEVNRR